MDENELIYIERAEEAILAAALTVEGDVSNRYFYQRQAELCIKLAEVEQQAVANSIADKQVAALSKLAKALEMLQNSIRQKKMS